MGTWARFAVTDDPASARKECRDAGRIPVRLLAGPAAEKRKSVIGTLTVMCGPPRVGETVTLNLQLLDGAFEALAIVRHSDDARSGFEFLNVAPDVQLRMESSIQESQVSPWPVNPFFRKVV